MIRYKFDIANALDRAGYHVSTASKWTNAPDDGTKPISKETFVTIRNNSPAITLETLNKICTILDMQPKDIIEYVPGPDDKQFLDHFRAIKPKKPRKSFIM